MCRFFRGSQCAGTSSQPEAIVPRGGEVAEQDAEGVQCVMPIYEYRCESCGAELEKLQKISDPPLSTCPACGKDTLAKLVSASSFRLKGSGWYETDFKTGKKKNGVGEASGAAGSGTADTAAAGSGTKADALAASGTSAAGASGAAA
jgi:putative FmdB family regulatory protein